MIFFVIDSSNIRVLIHPEEQIREKSDFLFVTRVTCVYAKESVYGRYVVYGDDDREDDGSWQLLKVVIIINSDNHNSQL